MAVKWKYMLNLLTNDSIVIVNVWEAPLLSSNTAATRLQLPSRSSEMFAPMNLKKSRK